MPSFKTTMLAVGLLLLLSASFSFCRKLLQEQPSLLQAKISIRQTGKTRTSKNDAFTTENIKNCGNANISDSKDGQHMNASAPIPVRAAACGWYKCFFHMKSNPELGYLVGYIDPNATRYFTKFEGSMRVYNLAMRLQNQYGIRHFQLEPPYLIENPQSDLIDCIKSQAYPAKFEEKAYIKRIPKGENWHLPGFQYTGPLSTLVVQKNAVAPTPNLLFGCRPDKVETLGERLQIFLEQGGLVVNNDKGEPIESPALELLMSFAHTVQQETKSTLKLLELEGDWLLDDFQLLIDKNGQFFHIDLGHNGENRPGKYSAERMEQTLEQCRDAFVQLNELIHNMTSRSSVKVHS